MNGYSFCLKIHFFDTVFYYRDENLFTFVRFYDIYVVCPGLKDIIKTSELFVLVRIYIKPYKVCDKIFTFGKLYGIFPVNVKLCVP